MTQDYETQDYEARVNWAAVGGSLAVVIVLLVLLGLGFKAIVDNTRLQEHADTAIVNCIKAGGEPLVCRTALGRANL